MRSVSTPWRLPTLEGNDIRMGIRTALLAVVAVAVAVTLAINIMNRSAIAELGESVLEEHTHPNEVQQYIHVRRKSDGREGRITRLRGETMAQFIARAEDILEAKAECWESNGVEWTVITEPEGDEGKEALCERHDALVAELKHQHPKTGECETP